MTGRALALLLAVAAASAAPQPRSPWSAREMGVLLLGHGGTAQWNQAVDAIRKSLSKKFPIEVAFGMADTREIQRGLDRLAARRVKKVVVVPLFISSRSEVIDQTMYVLGMRKEPSEEFLLGVRKMQERMREEKRSRDMLPRAHDVGNPVKRAKTKVPVVMTSALDDHPLLGEILAARAKELSRRPDKETVVIIGHGPWRDEDNDVWLRNLNALAAAVKKQDGFEEVDAATLRDDAEDKVRAEAVQRLRDLIRERSRHGKVIIVPSLLAPGGIEHKLPRDLDGTFYAWNGKTLLPDERITRWVELKAAEGLAMTDMRLFKDDGRPIAGPERRRLIPIDRTKAQDTQERK